MKLQKTITVVTGFLMLISQIAMAGNKPPIPAAFSRPKTIKIPSTTDLPAVVPEAQKEISLLGCSHSRPACRPNFVLQRTGCPTSGPYTYDSDYECYTCAIDPSITNSATCAPGWVLSWTTAGYSCSSDCRESCRNTYNNDHDVGTLATCLSSCPSAPSLLDGHGCAEGFTQYNQEYSSYSCVFSNAPATTTQDPVCATCGAQGSYIHGTNAEFNCVRHINTATTSSGMGGTTDGTGGSTEVPPKPTKPESKPVTARPEPTCSTESDCDDHDPCTVDKCVLNKYSNYCTHLYIASLCKGKPTTSGSAGAVGGIGGAGGSGK